MGNSRRKLCYYCGKSLRYEYEYYRITGLPNRSKEALCCIECHEVLNKPIHIVRG